MEDVNTFYSTLEVAGTPKRYTHQMPGLRQVKKDSDSNASSYPTVGLSFQSCPCYFNQRRETFTKHFLSFTFAILLDAKTRIILLIAVSAV